MFEFENYELLVLLAGRAGQATCAGEEVVRVMVRRRGWLTARIPGPRRGNGSGSEHFPRGVRDDPEVTLRNWAAERWGCLGHLVRVGELSCITLVGV